jgi:hypothetical protein
MATGTVKMIPSRIRTDDQRRTFLGREGSCSRSGHDDGRREAEKAAEGFRRRQRPRSHQVTAGLFGSADSCGRRSLMVFPRRERG